MSLYNQLFVPTEGRFTGSDEELIMLIEKYPVIYDKKAVNFFDQTAKKEAWAEIGLLLEQSATACQRRYVTLRNKYGVLKKAVRKTPYASVRSSAATARIKPWPLYPLMGFLDAFIHPRRSYRYVLNRQMQSPKKCLNTHEVSKAPEGQELPPAPTSMSRQTQSPQKCLNTHEISKALEGQELPAAPTSMSRQTESPKKYLNTDEESKVLEGQELAPAPTLVSRQMQSPQKCLNTKPQKVSKAPEGQSPPPVNRQMQSPKKWLNIHTKVLEDADSTAIWLTLACKLMKIKKTSVRNQALEKIMKITLECQDSDSE